MRQITLQTLTWGTVTAAVSSALWLAATEPGTDVRALHGQPLIRPTDAGRISPAPPQATELALRVSHHRN